MDDGYSINDEEIEGGDMPGQGSAGGWNHFWNKWRMRFDIGT